MTATNWQNSMETLYRWGILPIDDVSIQLMSYFVKIKKVVDKEYEHIHNHKYYNAELR